jgi:hypothetical protein
MQRNSSTSGWKRSWWRKLISVLVVVAVVLTIMSPELAFLGFLLDPLILDVSLLLFGAQLLLFSGHIKAFVVSAYLGMRRRLPVFRLRRRRS